MRRRRSSAARMAVGSAALALAASLMGCGVPLDKSPRSISRTTIRPDEVTPTTSASRAARKVSVYFLRGDHLVAQSYPVEGTPMLGQAVTFALQSPAKGSSESLRTAVPPDTELLGAEITNGVASINLGNGINAVSGESQKQAFAQMVYTALAFDGVTEVGFSIEGKPVDAPTDGANQARLTAKDYDPPLRPG